jgi:hypothetical protein
MPARSAAAPRYAVEDDQDRLTLDCCVYTDRHNHLGYGVLDTRARIVRPPLLFV